MTLTNLGAALREAGRLGEAITACQDAATIRREVGDRQGDGNALGNLGIALRQAGRLVGFHNLVTVSDLQRHDWAYGLHVLDTGVRAHPWLGVRAASPGHWVTRPDGFATVDGAVQAAIPRRARSR